MPAPTFFSRFAAPTLGGLALLLVLLTTSSWGYAQTPFMSETEFLVRDGGRWQAVNTGGSPDFFGADHAWAFDENGAPNIMTFSVYGYNAGSDSVQYWQGVSGWDPISQTVEVRQFGSFSGPNQAIATGTEARINETTTELSLTIRYAGGTVVDALDRAIVTGPDTYTSQSFQNGVLVGELQWTRVTTTTAQEPSAEPMPSAHLAPPYPNPTDRVSTFDYELATSGLVRLDVFDVQGRLVRTLLERQHAAGPHTASWDGTDDAGRRVASGMYLYRLQTPTDSVTQRVTLVH